MERNTSNSEQLFSFGTDTSELPALNSQDIHHINLFDSQDLNNVSSQDLNLSSQDYRLLEEVTPYLLLQDNTANHQQNPEESEFITVDTLSSMNTQVSPLVTSSQNDCDISRFQSLSTASMPALDSFEGLFNFSAELGDVNASSWVHSEVLDQVFIDMNKVLVMEFTLKFNPYLDGSPLFIRATPVYPNSDDVTDPVNRCLIHFAENDKQSIASHQDGKCYCSEEVNWAGHVVTTEMKNAIYCYNETSKRHSVLVPMPMPTQSNNCLRIPFRFTCKTSCVRGMNRRHIRLIFTLEKSFTFEVLGRKSLLVKICSCPKRDMDRHEKDYFRFQDPMDNRSITNTPINRKKKMHESVPRHHAIPIKTAKIIIKDPPASDLDFENALPSRRNGIKEKLMAHLKSVQQQRAQIDRWEEECRAIRAQQRAQIDRWEEECRAIIRMIDPSLLNGNV